MVNYTNSMRKLVTCLALLVLAIMLPHLGISNYYLHVVIMSLIFAIAVYGLNLMEGYLGLLSMVQAGFFGIGAYMSALLTLKLGMSFWLALPLTALATTLFSVLIGLISFRTRGHYFVIITLCIGIIINLVIEKWEGLTEGVRGLIGIPYPSNLGPIGFNTIEAQYYLVLAFLIMTIFAMKRLMDSLVGRTFRSIRNSEELASTLGINVMANKLLAFAIAAFFTGIAGALYASYIRFLGPEISHPHLSFELLLYLLIGGQATMAGPVVGTLVATGLSESLQSLQEWRMVVFGLLLVLIVKFFPWGLVGAAKKLWALKQKPLKGRVLVETMPMKPSKGEGYDVNGESFN